MARVEEAEVLEIIDTDLTSITAFITAANIVVTEKLSDAGMPDELLKEIERWLTAHFIAIRDPRISEETIGDATQRYVLGANTYSNAGKDVAGLNATPYGQQVLLLDISGTLGAEINKKKASFSVLG